MNEINLGGLYLVTWYCKLEPSSRTIRWTAKIDCKSKDACGVPFSSCIFFTMDQWRVACIVQLVRTESLLRL